MASMWPFRKKTRQRRAEVRKAIPGRTVSFWRRFRQGGGVVSLMLAAIFFVGAMLTDAIPIDPFTYRAGQYVGSDIYARVSFKIESPKQAELDKQKARESTPPTYRLNEAMADDIIGKLKAMPRRLSAATRPADVEESLQKGLGLSNEEELKAWQGLADPAQQKEYDNQLDQLREKLADTPIVSDADLGRQHKLAATKIIIAHDRNYLTRSAEDLIGVSEDPKLEQKAAELAKSFDPRIRANVRAYLMSLFMSGQPLYAYDDKATLADINEAIAKINANPPTEFYEAGKPLVLHTRKVGHHVGRLGEDDLVLLAREHREFGRAELQMHPWRNVERFAGRAGMLLAVTVILCLYLSRYQPRVVRNHWRGLALAVLLLLMLGINKIGVTFLSGWNPYMMVLPSMMVAVILAIAYDQGFAFVTGAVLAVFLTLQVRADLATCIVLLSATTAGAVQLREVRTRLKLIEMSAITAAAVFAAVWFVSLARGVPWWPFIVIDSLWAAGAAVLVGFLIHGVLPLIERTFRIATSMTLLEWCDASKPLLKRLAMEAPGTYNHSLLLGTMCESAAEAIGARGLLARVGAYYHDIGKLLKPEFFVENQAGSASRHAKLSPAMSLLIIIGHVRDGLELAHEYGLPRVLHEFIATHHGTTLVQYFYHAAAEQRKSEIERAPDEVEFRYPGPKPRTRESAILMLADASESSVRAMPEPTPGRIENQVHAIVSRRLMDGQLDECDLTLREVHEIESSFIKSLCGIYHARIAYPTPAGQKPAPAEKPAPKREEAASGAQQPPASQEPAGGPQDKPQASQTKTP